MERMFQDARSFNQDISTWNVSNVNDMSNIFAGENALTDENKCAIYTNWSTNPNWPYDWSVSCLIPITQDNIQEAVDLWTSNPTQADSIYGHISGWDVSNVTSMESLFQNKTTFNDDISQWDVSSVTGAGMVNMFNSSAFNGDLSNWDLSGRVTAALMVIFTVFAAYFITQITIDNQPIENIDWVGVPKTKIH